MGPATRHGQQETPATPRVLSDSRTRFVALPPALAFQPIRDIGGDAGWYYANLLWRLRGLVDLVLGGPGPWRRRHPQSELAPGQVIDAWRIEAFEEDSLLLLKAEMKLPGQAWLRFDVQPAANGSAVRQTATFLPAGLAGLLYWYLLLPVHKVMFRGMLKAIVNEARRRCSAPEAASSRRLDEQP